MVLLAAAMLKAQSPALARLKQEADRAKALDDSTDESRKKAAEQMRSLHAALGAWIDSYFLKSDALSPNRSSQLESMLQRELDSASWNTHDPAKSFDDDPEGPGYGYVGIEFKSLPELPNSVFVTAHASVPCGSDEAVYLYNYSRGKWTRALADLSKTDWERTYARLELSEPDAQGQRLLVIHYLSAQCASTWMAMAYSVYRLGPEATTLLQTQDHGFWLGNDSPEFVLKADELLIEFLDSSVDGGVHNRTEIQRYKFGTTIERLDPVAFQPQDFVEEWLTRPWTEMQSRSAAGLSEWHGSLSADYVRGDYSEVTRCGGSPGHWLIGLNIARIGAKDISDAETTYFLVAELGDYRYRMEAVGSETFPACPSPEVRGPANAPSEQHPWLSPAQLRALR